MVKAVRGAIQLERDNADEIIQGVDALVRELMSLNSIPEEDIISLQFSITPDLTSINPAGALRRSGGFASVPLFCAQEPVSQEMLPRMIRILLTCEHRNELPLKPHYLGGARALRPDLFSSSSTESDGASHPDQ